MSPAEPPKPPPPRVRRPAARGSCAPRAARLRRERRAAGARRAGGRRAAGRPGAATATRSCCSRSPPPPASAFARSRACGPSCRASTPGCEALEAALAGPSLAGCATRSTSRRAGATHTSASLADALRDEAARRLDATPLADGAAAPAARARPCWPRPEPSRSSRSLAALAPVPTLRAWRTLWNPALAAPPVTLAVEPGIVTVIARRHARGARPRRRLGAPRRGCSATAPTPRRSLEAVEHGQHRWRFDLPPVTRARRYAVRVLAARSPDYRIALAGEPQPVSFSFEYRAPAYARLPAQTGTLDARRRRRAARLGRGRRGDVRPRHRIARRARCPAAATQAWSAVTPRRWRGRLSRRRPTASGRCAPRPRSGGGTSRWRVSALADAPPVISVARPAGDQDLPSGSQIPYDVLVQDDLGLSDLRLQFRKEAAQPWRDVPLAAFAGEPREARVAAAWDAAALALLPGESGTFRFVVRDNDRVGGPGSATSPEFRLRFPTMAELYQNLDHRQDRVQQSLRQVADQARELQKTLDQLQRQQPRPGTAHAAAVRAQPRRCARRSSASRRSSRAGGEGRRGRAPELGGRGRAAGVQPAAAGEAARDVGADEADPVARVPRRGAAHARGARAHGPREPWSSSCRGCAQANRDLMQSVERNLALLRQLRDEERMRGAGAARRRAEDSSRTR